MSSNVVNQVAYLRTSRNFPEENSQLCVELNKSYVDTANAVNSRIIGIYPTNRPALTGEAWYLVKAQKQQSLRQVYTFTTTTAIDHNIEVLDISQFINCYGSYTNGTNSFGLPFGTSTATPGLITFYLTTTQIIFVLGAGAPALTSGKIVLHWLSQV